jgi:hypothetical protein
VKPAPVAAPSRARGSNARTGTDEDLRGWGVGPDDFDTKELPEFVQSVTHD